MKLKRSVVCASVVVCLASTLPLRAGQGTNRWDAWQFLLGEWIGGGRGDPGKGSGSFTFSLDLQDEILVRRNHTEYPATSDRAAFSHDDLMVVYQEPRGPAQAVYFDNEGHVIHYTAEFSTDSDTLTFLSELVPSAPRFRLTYVKKGKGELGVTFDIASRDRPQVFSRYIEGTAQRRK